MHLALAEATDPESDPDRRAWHRAHAASGLDENLAEELERLAARAQARGGVAAAAAFLERAAELTPDSARRGRRALAAAQAKYESGIPEVAQELLAAAERCPLDELQRAQLTRLRAEIVFALNRGSDAPPLLLDAAKQLEPLDAGLAREAYLEALGAAVFAGRLNRRVGPAEVAAAAQGAPPGRQPPQPTDLLLDGLVTRFTAGYVAGVAPLRRALDASSARDEGRRGGRLHALVLAAMPRCRRLVGRRDVARGRDPGDPARPRVRRAHGPTARAGIPRRGSSARWRVRARVRAVRGG